MLLVVLLGGLEPELNIVVKITNPTSLSQVYRSARMQEAYLQAVKQPDYNHTRKFLTKRILLVSLFYLL